MRVARLNIGSKAAMKKYVNKLGTARAFLFEAYATIPVGFAVRGSGLLKLQE